jgi:rfaE bifunctional protein nucleotidyltransferase chain/domain
MVVGPDGTLLLEVGAGEEARVTELDEKDLPMARSRFCPAGERPRPACDREKRVDLPKLLDRLDMIRQQQSRIAFTNGCFDILHSGHVAYLEKARSTADCLVVGLNSDRSVKALKGMDRPVNSEQDRVRILSSLACVDYVVIFDEETPYNLITTILPDILVKGADWAEENIVGAPEVKAAGGKIIRVAFEHNVSTSGLISRIQTRE